MFNSSQEYKLHRYSTVCQLYRENPSRRGASEEQRERGGFEPRNPKGFGITYPKKQLGLYDPLAEAKKRMKEREAADTIKVDDPFS